MNDDESREFHIEVVRSLRRAGYKAEPDLTLAYSVACVVLETEENGQRMAVLGLGLMDRDGTVFAFAPFDAEGFFVTGMNINRAMTDAGIDVHALAEKVMGFTPVIAVPPKSSRH